MTKQQYEQFHLYIPILRHVWNTVPDSDTGISPFEAEHGMKCRSIAESIVEQVPKEGLPANAEDLKAIAVSARAFMESLTNVKKVEKALASIKLNADGSSKHTYQVGDRVSFYLPPDDKKAQKMGRKRKHILQYTGPGVIAKQLSPNATSFRIEYKGRSYNRNVMHINKYRAANEVPAALQLVIDYTVSVGSYVAVLDQTEDQRYHMAQVIDMTDEVTTLHLHGNKRKKTT